MEEAFTLICKKKFFKVALNSFHTRMNDAITLYHVNKKKNKKQTNIRDTAL